LLESASGEDVVWNANITVFYASGNGEAQIHSGKNQAFLVPGMGHAVNQLLTHYALRTDELDDVRKHLNECGIPFSNCGDWAVKSAAEIPRRPARATTSRSARSSAERRPPHNYGRHQLRGRRPHRRSAPAADRP
jgi:hypothetical protein